MVFYPLVKRAGHRRDDRGRLGVSRSALIVVWLACALAGPWPLAQAAPGEVLEQVRTRGYVKCAIGNRPVGDTRLGVSGYEGFFPEFCRVIALALFNDRSAVQLSPMLIRHGLQSIAEGDVDVYVSNVTWTFSRDLTLQLTPAAVLYHDGQGFLSHRGTVTGALTAVGDATVCVSRSTTTLANLEDFIRLHERPWTILAFESSEGRNDAFLTAADDPDNYVLHDEVISSEPLVAYVGVGDMVWGNVVRWAILATILAEEKGITSGNYTDFLASPDPAIRRLLGLDPMPGSEAVGLAPAWARNVIAGAGNYGEIFDRYLGEGTPLGMKRGANALARDGGLMVSPPLR